MTYSLRKYNIQTKNTCIICYLCCTCLFYCKHHANGILLSTFYSDYMYIFLFETRWCPHTSLTMNSNSNNSLSPNALDDYLVKHQSSLMWLLVGKSVFENPFLTGQPLTYPETAPHEFAIYRICRPDPYWTLQHTGHCIVLVIFVDYKHIIVLFFFFKQCLWLKCIWLN